MEKELIEAGKTLFNCIEFAKVQDDFYHKPQKPTYDEEAFYQRVALHFLSIISEAAEKESSKEKQVETIQEEVSVVENIAE